MFHNRIVIGSESNDERHIVLTAGGSQISVPVSLYDSSGNQISSFGGGGYGTFADNTQTVATAGTRIQLSLTSVPCKKVLIQAHESNTGTIVIGAITVVAALVGRRGYALFPTQSVEVEASNLNLVYIDSTASGDKVNFTYVN